MLLIHRYFLFLSIIVIFILQLSYASEADIKSVQKEYQDWCSAIEKARGKPQGIVKFYSKEAILLPTLSNKILHNSNQELDNYFIELTSMPDIKCVPEKLMTEVYGDIAVNNGFYQFVYKNKDGKVIVLPARFTFIYKKENNRWLIVTHHSSKLLNE